MRARLAPVTLAVAIVALAIAPSAFAGNGGIAPPDSATASGSQINDLWWILMGILITIFVLVEGALVWFVFRYRRRRGQAPESRGAAGARAHEDRAGVDGDPDRDPDRARWSSRS